MTDADNATVFHADVCANKPKLGIHDEGIRNDQIKAVGITRSRGLAHAIADDLAPAELHFVSVATGFGDVVAFHFDDEFHIAQADLVPYGWAIVFGILLSCQI